MDTVQKQDSSKRITASSKPFRTGIINNTFKSNKVQKGTPIKLYTTLALPVLLHVSEIWPVESKYKSRLTAAEMKFMQKTAKYTWRDHRTNK
jgi:hypothetical protein